MDLLCHPEFTTSNLSYTFYVPKPTQNIREYLWFHLTSCLSGRRNILTPSNTSDVPRSSETFVGLKGTFIGSLRSSRFCGLLKCRRPVGYEHVIAKVCWFSRHTCSGRVIHATEHKSTTAEGILRNDASTSLSDLADLVS